MCCSLPTVCIESILLESTSEVSVKLHLDWLLLVVLVALLRHTVHTLLAVEQVRSLVPRVTQCVDI